MNPPPPPPTPPPPSPSRSNRHSRGDLVRVFGDVVVNEDEVVTGQVVADDMPAILRGISRVRGAAAVDNRLEVHEDPQGVPSLQGN